MKFGNRINSSYIICKRAHRYRDRSTVKITQSTLSEVCSYHNIPNEVFRLGVEAFIPSSNCNLLGPKQVHHLHLQRPEAPTPILAIFVGFLSTVQFAQAPRFSNVQCYFHTCQFSSTTCMYNDTLTLHPKINTVLFFQVTVYQLHVNYSHNFITNYGFI